MQNLTRKCSTAKNNYFLYLIILSKASAGNLPVLAFGLV